MIVRLEAPPGFSFRRTVLSHGWALLPPFRLEQGATSVETVVTSAGSGAWRIRLAPGNEGVALEIAGRPTAAVRRDLERAARRMLNLDLDLTPFHDAVRRDPRFAWIAAAGAGRLLRAPSTWEDLVKLVLTTNCSWSLTTRMTRSLVSLYGEPAGDGSRAFPTAARLAGVPEREFRDTVKAGYRAPYLARIARLVASGEIDPDGWETGDRDVRSLRKEILRLPGVGPYVAENLLKFFGRPDGLALDSWMRAAYGRRFHGGRKVSDRTIARGLAPLGAWAALALWFELTRDWLHGDEPSSAWAALA